MTNKECSEMALMSKSELISLAMRLQSDLVALSQHDLLTRRGLAKFFQVSDRKLSQMLPLLPPPSYRHGRKQYWLRPDLVRWIKSQEVDRHDRG